MSDFSGFLRNAIEASNDGFSAGAHAERESFAREKRGYAKRLREILEGVEIRFDVHAKLHALLNDLDPDEAAEARANEAREDKIQAERSYGWPERNDDER